MDASWMLEVSQAASKNQANPTLVSMDPGSSSDTTVG